MEKAEKSRGAGGGSKLNRSETVTIRLDPRLRYLTELAARKQRRTVSSFIEWAIERTLDHIPLRENFRGTDASEVTIGEEAENLWDTDEADRIAKLGLYYPELLAHNEQVLWKLVRECGVLWQGDYDKQGHWAWSITPEGLQFQRLREYWETIRQIAAGELGRDSLPQVADRKNVPLVTEGPGFIDSLVDLVSKDRETGRRSK
jgi:hypothetical protein